jgi:4-alpha-glucanotransferase
MNLPGTASGNWRWRFDWPMVGDEAARRLAATAAASGRADIGLLHRA